MQRCNTVKHNAKLLFSQGKSIFRINSGTAWAFTGMGAEKLTVQWTVSFAEPSEQMKCYLKFLLAIMERWNVTK